MANQAAKRALNVVVFLGTVRENNMGSRAAKFMVNQLSAKGHQVKLLGKIWSSIVVGELACCACAHVLASCSGHHEGSEGFDWQSLLHVGNPLCDMPHPRRWNATPLVYFYNLPSTTYTSNHILKL